MQSFTKRESDAIFHRGRGCNLLLQGTDTSFHRGHGATEQPIKAELELNSSLALPLQSVVKSTITPVFTAQSYTTYIRQKYNSDALSPEKKRNFFEIRRVDFKFLSQVYKIVYCALFGGTGLGLGGSLPRTCDHRYFYNAPNCSPICLRKKCKINNIRKKIQSSTMFGLF